MVEVTAKLRIKEFINNEPPMEDFHLNNEEVNQLERDLESLLEGMVLASYSSPEGARYFEIGIRNIQFDA